MGHFLRDVLLKWYVTSLSARTQDIISTAVSFFLVFLIILLSRFGYEPPFAP